MSEGGIGEGIWVSWVRQGEIRQQRRRRTSRQVQRRILYSSYNSIQPYRVQYNSYSVQINTVVWICKTKIRIVVQNSYSHTDLSVVRTGRTDSLQTGFLGA